MAVTKILPRNGGLKEAIDYVLNGDKTDGHILTAHFNCDPGREYREMMKTKLETGRLDKRQCYHIIQSFKPGEITPELALEIAKAFAQEHLDGFEVVIGTHVDRGLRLVREAGIGAESRREDTEDAILLTIRIPKNRRVG